ncbi:MAG: hypothetical protein K0S81_3638 [Rhodospirillales bacterium]|jgi:hypothetical protein|nr:hypothetical protein [Rhodospirillales bacterium]
MNDVFADAAPGVTEANRHALRIALAATLSFAVAELLDWNFSFLGPLLSVQLLASRQAPPWPDLVAVPILVLLSTGAALMVSVALKQTPLAMLMIIGLVLFLSFRAHRLGAPPLATLLVQIGFASVPLIAAVSTEAAAGFAGTLFAAALTAIIIVWLAHAFIPAAPAAADGGAPRPTRTAEDASCDRMALLDTLVLLPLLIFFILGEDTNDIVILIVTITVLRGFAPGAGMRAALGLLIGNLIGGAAAALAYGFVSLTGSFVSFVLVLLASCLIFGDRIAKGGAKAPLFAIALATFILILGMAISPLPGGGAELFTTRLLKIGAAVLYVIGALAVLHPSRSGGIAPRGGRVGRSEASSRA